MSIEELLSSLLVHESRMKGHKEEEQALKVTVAGRTRSKERGKRRQTSGKESLKCYKFHKLGHFQYECPSWEEEEVLLMEVN